MDESQHSSCLRPSMFGKVHLQFGGAMTDSHMLLHLQGGERKQQLRH